MVRTPAHHRQAHVPLCVFVHACACACVCSCACVFMRVWCARHVRRGVCAGASMLMFLVRVLVLTTSAPVCGGVCVTVCVHACA